MPVSPNMLPSCQPLSIQTPVADVFARVWRTEFSESGFALLDAGPQTTSRDFRQIMVDLKQALDEILFASQGLRFTYRSLGRFDQQVTTRFHLDGAPPASLLMLGYESSKVGSRLFLADYSQAAFDMGISPAAFLQDYNPMYRKGEEALHGYSTELIVPPVGHATILLVNNSMLPPNSARTNPLGVMHKAEIEAPDASQARIVNSILLAASEAPAPDDREREAEFLASDAISPKVYQAKE